MLCAYFSLHIIPVMSLNHFVFCYGSEVSLATTSDSDPQPEVVHITLLLVQPVITVQLAMFRSLVESVHKLLVGFDGGSTAIS